jgi:HD-GYP domain-containing protein (c-di-GMP phosphodiesterase class II)
VVAPPDAGTQDSELPQLHGQLVMFAREAGELYAAERQRSRELEIALDGIEEMYVQTMKAFAQVVEAEDSCTGGHLDRTQRYAIAIAGRLAPELASRPAVAYGFFLHDIGKVGVPEHVLRKPGPLDGPEWELMRAHPAVGARIIEPISFLGEAVEIVHAHHEWFDGTGYPTGLKGEEIPLAARVFSIADSFDAMTSDRPYRPAMPIGAAVVEISRGAGTQFDPDAVAVFLELVEEDAITVRIDDAVPALLQLRAV